jgi:leader peptidase (prepilin peptidase)/N-methyltransferase
MFLFALAFAVFHFRPEAFATAILLSWLLALALIDLDTFLLPEALTRSGLMVGAAAQLLLPWISGNGSVMASLEAFIMGVMGAVCGIWALELVGWVAQLVLKREAMGLGDGKLLAMIGMWLGWQGVVLTIFFSSVVGTLGSGIGLLLRRVQWGKAIPFGPYLAIGGGVAALFGSQILRWYQSWWGWN